MLAHILARHPAPRGVLVDRPHVVTDAPALIEAHGLTSRVRGYVVSTVWWPWNRLSGS